MGGMMRLACHHGLLGIRSLVKLTLVILVLAVITGVILAINDGFKAKYHTAAWSDLRTVVTALSNFQAANKSYPPRLETLLESQDGLPPYLNERSLAFSGYQKQYAPTADGYVLRITPQAEGGMHFYVDQSGDIRTNLGAPADATSPEWSGYSK